MTTARRRELQRILASPMLAADARAGDREAREAIDTAREELRELDRGSEREEAA